jgi:hypothetical protein
MVKGLLRWVAVVLLLVLVWWAFGGINIHLYPEDIDSWIKVSDLECKTALYFLCYTILVRGKAIISIFNYARCVSKTFWKSDGCKNSSVILA